MMINKYFDNAATSFPKPASVAEYISKYLTESGGTYGRSAYLRVLESSETVEKVREKLAEKTGTAKPENITFTPNATAAINTVLFGLNLHDCHVLISPLEHNAVMRPLFEICQRFNVSFDILPHGPDGLVEVKKIKDAIKPSTRLVIINHHSNVNGLIQPLSEIKREAGEIPVLADLAQSLGHTDIFLDSWNIDFAAFTGHKGLLGPTGTGGLYCKDPGKISPLIYGGTGSRSESFEMPSFTPDKFEAGTPNIAGIYGLLGSLENYPEPAHSNKDILELMDQISRIEKVKVFRSRDVKLQGTLFSITHEQHSCSRIAAELYSEYGIEVRSGLHCAPLAHKTLGTFPSGTVRFAPSPTHTIEDFRYLYEAVRDVCK